MSEIKIESNENLIKKTKTFLMLFGIINFEAKVQLLFDNCSDQMGMWAHFTKDFGYYLIVLPVRAFVESLGRTVESALICEKYFLDWLLS